MNTIEVIEEKGNGRAGFSFVDDKRAGVTCGVMWFYVRDGNQQGPVSAGQLEALARAGTIDGETLVWRKGMADWQPFRRATADPIPTAHEGCVECGRIFPASELIMLNNSKICARCKPAYLQKLSEGATTTPGVAWRYGTLLVTETNTKLHDQCVKCNAPANGYRLKRELRSLFGRSGVIYVGLCEGHRRKRNRGLIIGWSGFTVCAVLLLTSTVLDSGFWTLSVALIAAASAITTGVMTNCVGTSKITREHLFVTGCHSDYLAELSEWPGE